MKDRKYKILLIEDDKIDQIAFTRMAKDNELFYDCTITGSVSEAKQALSVGKFDIVVTDYSLGDGTAFDILNMVNDIPVIFVTGVGNEEVATKSWKAGAYDYLIKDIEGNYLKTLPNKIENVIQHKKMEEIIHRKQKNLEAIFDAVPVGMLLVDENMTVKRVNDAIRQMVGREYRQIINRPVGNAISCINSTHSEKGCGNSPACTACQLRKSAESVLREEKDFYRIEFQPTLEVDNKQINLWLRAITESLMIDDRKHVVISVEDITEHKQAELSLKERLRFEQLVSTVSSGFVNVQVSEEDQAIKDGLRLVGEFFDVDRVSLGQIVGNKHEPRTTHIWLSDNYDPKLNVYAHQINCPNIASHLQRDGAFVFGSLDELPTNWTQERQFATKAAIKAGVVVRLKLGGAFLGALAIYSLRAERTWTNDVTQRLKLIGEIFANTINRRRAEETMRQNEERYRLLFENTGTANAVISGEGVFLMMNNLAAAYLGGKPKEIIGRSICDFLTKEAGNEHLAKITEVIESGRQITYENLIELPLGSRWFLTNLQPVKDASGDMTYVQVISQDITERKKAECELQMAEERYRTIFENSAVAITMADEQEHLISWNKFTENLLCFNGEDLYQRPVKSLYPVKEWEKIRAHNIRQKGMQYHVETKMVKKNGEVIDVDLSLSVLKNADCKTTGSVGVFRDITERKQAEKEIRKTMELKSQFISTVSHELRTPLTCMKNAVVNILDGAVGKINDKQRNCLSIARRNIDRLGLLINDVLDFQKLEAGRSGFNVQQNDICEVIREVHNTMASYAKEEGIDLLVELQDNIPKTTFDRNMIIQLLTNLLGNAIKFTPEQGKVSIRTKCESEELFISVEDTGIGIPKESLPRIFDRFYRVPEHEQKIAGTGLGLAIVKRIVLMHGGRIEVESKQGEGTTFTVVLPTKPSPTPEAPSEEMDEILENAVTNQEAQHK